MSRNRVLRVVGHVEIEPAVAVIVDKGRRDTPAGIAGAGDGGGVREGAVAVVAIEPVGAEVGDIEVGPAVVVVVAGGDAHAVAAGADAAGRGDVDKARPSAAVGPHLQVVAVQPVDRSIRRCRADRVESTALHQVDIQIAVTVEVEQRPAGTHHLAEVEAAGHAVDMRKVEPAGRRDVDKQIFSRRRGGGRRGQDRQQQGEQKKVSHPGVWRTGCRFS